MNLRTKLATVFGVALAVNLGVIFFGLTYILDSLSSKLMEKQAETVTIFLQHRIVEMAKSSDDESLVNGSVRDFDMAKHVADEGRGFDIRTILLIKKDYTVEASFPSEEQGKSYAEHKDIREAFITKKAAIVVEESKGPNGKTQRDIDVVSYFRLPDGEERVIEVKLDFAKSIVLLEAQYSKIEFGAIAAASVFLVILLGILLLMIGRTAIRPVLKVSGAMERVGSGDLDVKLDESSHDEFGTLARRFNEMVTGLKEKLHLTRYVSKSTMNAVTRAVESDTVHITERKILTLFFSDIRGFTTFSESRDPSTVIDSLNKILSVQSRIIEECGGDVDKFVGDEVMAIFEKPSDAINAAIAIQDALENIRESIDGLHIGIGIHLGEVVQGDVGSDKMKDYTVIGDSVNTAARLQSISAADEILVSEITAKADDVRGAFVFSTKGDLKLKGKDQAITTYKVKRKI